jgi:WD40 repeat protein/energy-coupling factor transporter ATP-binding protein EcfA2
MIAEGPLALNEIERTGNPFPGLRPFEEDESHLFYGREGQSKDLLTKLRETYFLAVVGMSGSGKSSLVRAGLLSEIYGGSLGKSGSGWHIAMMRPGNDPIGNLARALNESGALDREGKEVNQIQTHVTLGRSSRGLVDAVLEARLKPHENLLVVVDQFEELFRFAGISEDEEYANHAAAFVELLLEAKREKSNIYVVLTMRSDYLGHCDQFWDLPEAINEGQYLIPRMTRDQRREAIVRPAEVYFATITPGLINELLNDMGESPNQLPILQHALMRIWETWHKDGDLNAPLDLCHYRRIGGLAEILSRHADEAYKELKGERPRQIAEKLFKCLTEKGKDDKETRRPTELREICLIADASEEEVIAVINIFRREGRCFLMPAENVPLESSTSIDISHESLISCWGKLDKWVKEEAESAGVYGRLADDAIRYRTVGLLRDNRLQEALDWREHNRPNVAWASHHHASFYREEETSQEARRARDKEIFQSVMTLIDKSEKKRAQEEEAKNQEALKEEQERLQKLKRARIYVLVSVTVSILILGLALIAWEMRDRAREQSRMINLLKYRTIVNLAQKAYGSEKYGEANQLLGTLSPKDQEDVHGFFWHYFWRVFDNEYGQEDLRGFDWYYLWQLLHNERGTLKGHSGNVSCVAISPDGRTIATGSEDHLVKLWDANTGESRDLKGHGDAITSVAFAPDGKTLATGSADETLKFWDAATGSEIKTLSHSFSIPQTDKPKSRTVRSIAFARNGLMAIGLGDGTVMTISGAKTTPLQKHMGLVWSVAFSPDGAMLVSGAGDGTVKLWNFNTGQGGELRMLSGSKGIFSVAFSPDGKTIVAGTKEGLIRRWDAASGEEIESLGESVNARVSTGLANSHSDADFTLPAVLSLTFGDNDTLITGHTDATLRLWKISDRKEIAKLKGHSDVVSSVAFSPDGKTVVTGSADDTAKLWDISPQSQDIRPNEQRLNEQPPEVSSIAFFPGKEGNLLVCGRADGSIALWDPKSRREQPQHMDKSGAKVLSVVVLNDQTIASWSADQVARLWNPATGALPKSLPIPSASKVTSVAFSPDGKMLAIGSFDSTVMLWDISTEAKPIPLPLKDAEKEKHLGTIWSVAFSSDGKILATGSADRKIKLWDTSNGEILGTLLGHTDDVLNIAFSPDDELLASGSSDNTAKLWEVATRKELATLSGHTSAVKFVAFSPNGMRLITRDDDASVKLWDTVINQPELLVRWQELVKFHSDDSNKIQSLAFSPDGMMLAIGREHGDVELWLATTPERVDEQSKKIKVSTR